ncbi:MAG: DUF3857 domain-containing protein [Bryobacteraceae bacterium]|jgi:hypothetical protein
MKPPVFLTLFLTLILAFSRARAADRVPDWVTQQGAAKVSSYPDRVNSVTLLKEDVVTIDPDGRRVMRERGAIRILQRGGEEVEAYRTYNTKNGRIRDFAGWLVPSSGKPVPYAKNRILDVALSRDYVYDEARAKVLECGPALPGSTFVWEVTEEEKSVFTQDGFRFQNRSPVLVSRYQVTLPVGWEANGVLLNHDRLEPSRSGNTYTWELRDLPWIELEDHSPSLTSLAPRLAVSFFPPADNPAGLKGLKDWTTVSSWLSGLVEPSAEVTDTVRAKAAQLTAGASSELEKIASIARFTQATNYIEVALNITRGGGYTPHPSSETLARNYGDCKDKATLMRSLLKAAGIDSYLVVITAGDRTYVRPEWASPMQFNHAIVAVRVSDAIALPAVLTAPQLGRLLIFDPTDPITLLGDLPAQEQGSHALVIAGDRGALLTMPRLSAAANRIESSVGGSVDANGRLTASIERTWFGQAARPLRATETLRGSGDLKKLFERSLSARLGATVNKLGTEAKPEQNSITASLDVTAEGFAQSMQGRLFIVRPGLLTSGGDYFFKSRQRTVPVRLESDLRRDTIRIKLPAGFKLDELPANAKIESAYGNLEAKWSLQDGEIVMEQTLEIRETVAPVSEYAKVRDFFDKVDGAQAAPVVLVKQ